MSNRLYFNSPYLQEFSARIVDITEIDSGFKIQLDQTAFYPTSGGQPHDTGWINGIHVKDVLEDEKDIWHIVESKPKTDEIIGQIDWSRRYDHMQQHTGQHILSKAFFEDISTNTIGFQMGSEYSTIDLDIPSLTQTEIQKVEISANRIVWENHPVIIHYITKDDVAEIPFRKPPQVDGIIRVIWIVGVDVSACGGTHVNTTGEIGLIKISDFERYKGNTRLYFVCGNRALKDYQNIHNNILQVCKDLSINKDELPQAISRMKNEIISTAKALKASRKEIMEIEADKLWENTGVIDGVKYIYDYLENRQYEDLIMAVNRLRSYPKTVCLLGIKEGDKLRIVCSRSKDKDDINAGKIIKSVVALLGGKGGGTTEIAHGGASMANPELIRKAFKKVIESYDY